MDYTKEDTITIDLSSITTSVDFTAATIEPFGALDPYYGAVPPNISIASGTYTTAALSPDILISDSMMNMAPSAKISLTGENADIDVNGVSLMETIRGIQDRLNILCPDPAMEAEWDELRELRQQYEVKLAECKEKSRAWKALKQQG